VGARCVAEEAAQPASGGHDFSRDLKQRNCALATWARLAAPEPLVRDACLRKCLCAPQKPA